MQGIASGSDAGLMAEIASGSEAALAALYDRHSHVVFAFCLRSLGDRMEAEDLVLEIFMELWRIPHRYDAARANPLTYLLQVTRSRVVDRLRVRKPRPPVDRPSDEPGLAASPLEDAVIAEQRVRVRRALDGLAPDQRAAVELAFFDALSHAEIAKRLGEPLGTIKSRIRQAFSRLRDALRHEGPE